MKFRLIITLLLLIVVMVFAVQNVAIVEIDFLIWKVEIPRSLLIFLMLVIGFIMGWFTKAMFRLSRSTEEVG